MCVSHEGKQEEPASHTPTHLTKECEYIRARSVSSCANVVKFCVNMGERKFVSLFLFPSSWSFPQAFQAVRGSERARDDATSTGEEGGGRDGHRSPLSLSAEMERKLLGKEEKKKRRKVYGRFFEKPMTSHARMLCHFFSACLACLLCVCWEKVGEGRKQES